MSAGLATARVPPLHGPTLHHDGLDGPEALGGGNLTFPSHGLEHQVVLIGGQRIVGQHCRGITYEVGEEIRVGHDPSDQIAETSSLHTPPCESVVTPAGFEPAVSTLKGSRPGPG